MPVNEPLICQLAHLCPGWLASFSHGDFRHADEVVRLPVFWQPLLADGFQGSGVGAGCHQYCHLTELPVGSLRYGERAGHVRL